MADAEQASLIPVGVAQRALHVAGSLRQRFLGLPAGRRNALACAAVMLAATIAGIAWFAGRQDWRVAFSGLESRDAQTVSQELSAAGIAFQMTPDGTGIQVPAEFLEKARMEVAAKGMPQTGRMGFELFDKPNWVGSEFDERVNYERALEGELEHTIATLGAVRSARVHLVLPQASLFTSEEKLAKASVVLKLKRASLSPEQTESIRNLVASSVENLSPEQVTLVDADGRLNLQAKGRAGHGFAAAADAEQGMESRLVAMLEPLAGAGNVRASVNVSYEDGSEERTDEVYDPAATALLSTQKSEQVSGGAKVAQGIPGTASNTPAASPAGALQGSATAAGTSAGSGVPPLLQGKDALPVYPTAGGGATQSMKEESGTYAVTKHVIHTELAPGRTRRMTAAVVINDRMVTEGTGKTEHAVWKPRTSEEMHRLEELAQAAIGFDSKRGDQVVVENVSFGSNAPETSVQGMAKNLEMAKDLLRSQPALLRSALMGLLSLLVVWFVLRPIAGQMVATLKEPVPLGRGSANDHLLPGDRGAVVASDDIHSHSPASAETVRSLRPRTGHAIFEQVSDHIKREPAQSTRLLESWISAEGAAD